MRVISGSLGKRVFAAPDSPRIHPMSEKVRGAIFSALGDISGLVVLDVYSGSGALGIEAVSRGADQVISIEADAKAAALIIKNLKELNISNRVSVINARIESWLDSDHTSFDLIIADPPYDRVPLTETLNSIASRLKSGCLLVLSWPGNHELPKIQNATLIKVRSFKDAQVGFYRN